MHHLTFCTCFALLHTTCAIALRNEIEEVIADLPLSGYYTHLGQQPATSSSSLFPPMRISGLHSGDLHVGLLLGKGMPERLWMLATRVEETTEE